VSQLVLTDRSGKAISDWRAWTRPKRDYQWRAGRSAMELARAWFVAPMPTCPPEVTDLLATHRRTSALTLIQGFPEYVTSLPERGEGRNHDLLLIADGDTGRAVISIEAKVDESFGETIGTYWAKAKQSTAPTRAPERIEALLSIAFGASARPDRNPWRPLRYQLLTAVTGTAIEAARRQAAAAVVIVHEFRTESTDHDNVAVNTEDFQSFVGALVGLSPDQVIDGRLYGPARLEPSPHLERAVDVLIGKAVFDWDRADVLPNKPIEPTTS